MEMRAAVPFEAEKPLSIETVDLEGTKGGEVLVEDPFDVARLGGVEHLVALRRVVAARSSAPSSTTGQPTLTW